MTPLIRNPKVRRVGLLAALAAWATVALFIAFPEIITWLPSLLGAGAN